MFASFALLKAIFKNSRNADLFLSIFFFLTFFFTKITDTQLRSLLFTAGLLLTLEKQVYICFTTLA